MSSEILFYDLSAQSSVRANKCFSSNTLYDALSDHRYKTVWVEYHEIESVAKKLGANATRLKPNGGPWYTIPIIYDQSTGVIMSESSDTVRYLDKQYPLSPRVITPGTLAFETVYYNYFIANVWLGLPRCIHLYLYETTTPESAAFLKELREAAFGDTLVNISKDPQPQWDACKEVYGSVALPTYEKAEGVFLKGNEPGWADFVMASWTLFIKLVYVVKSKEWKYAEAWHNGRWTKLINDLEPYAHIDE